MHILYESGWDRRYVFKVLLILRQRKYDSKLCKYLKFGEF